MWQTISETAVKYMAFYERLVTGWWNTITFWQYIGLMVTCLVVGYVWMSRGATNS